MKYKIKKPGNLRVENGKLQMLTAKKTVSLQLQMQNRVITKPDPHFDPRYIAGIDVSIRDGIARAAVVTLDFQGLPLVEAATAWLLEPIREAHKMGGEKVY